MSEFKENISQLPPEDRRYLLETLPGFLVSESDVEPLLRLLTDFDFIEAKLADFGVQSLLADYEAALESDVLLSGEKVKVIESIQGAIRLSAHILEVDRSQLLPQLWGRLLDFDAPEIRELLEGAKQWRDAPWLRPLAANLTPPGGPLLRTLTGHTNSVWAVALTPDGTKAVSGSRDYTLKIWDLARGTELATLTGHTREVTAVALTPDGTKAVSGSRDKTLKIWDLATGTELATLTGYTSYVRAVALTPDGTKAVSGSDDKTLKIWDLATGKKLRTLTGHTREVRAVALTPDGTKAVSGSDDKTLKIWNLATGEEVMAFAGDSPFYCCAVSPDGKTIVAGDDGGVVHFLRMEGV